MLIATEGKWETYVQYGGYICSEAYANNEEWTHVSGHGQIFNALSSYEVDLLT